MRKILILVLVGVLLAAAFSMMPDAGYVRISIGHWLVESNLIVLLLSLSVLYLALFVLMGGWRRVVKTPVHLFGWVRGLGARRAYQRTTRGLLAFAEGDWRRASSLLQKSAEKTDTPLINYLAAAQASFELGQDQETERLLKKAHDASPEGEFAIGLTQAQLQLGRNQLEQCLATLVRLKKNSPNHPHVLKLLKTVYLKLEDWQQLSQLLPQLKRQHLIEDSEYRKLERDAWVHLFSQTADDIRRLPADQYSIDSLVARWDSLPGSARKDEIIIHAYAAQLAALGEGAHCETLLRKVLRHHWSDMLINLYGRVAGANVEEQLLTAETWLKERPNDAALLLALGRLSLRNELWGKAKEYFEASHKLHKTAESYGELCRLAIHLEEKVDSRSDYVQGIIGSLCLPELPLPR